MRGNLNIDLPSTPSFTTPSPSRPDKMYIKSVVIDGFKSYGQRTEINGFDPLFNAITGLNGSGKSNILDSICFLLGITNLSQVSLGGPGTREVATYCLFIELLKFHIQGTNM